MPVKTKELHILCGLPGVGKTFFRKKFLQRTRDFFAYSTDDIIEFAAMSNRRGRTFNQMLSEAAVVASRIEAKRLKSALSRGDSVIFDQCNLQAEERRVLLERMRPQGFSSVVCHYFRPPLDTEPYAKQEWGFRLRCMQKCGRAPEDPIMGFLQESAEEPTLQEGFSTVHVYNLWGREVNRRGKSLGVAH